MCNENYISHYTAGLETFKLQSFKNGRSRVIYLGTFIFIPLYLSDNVSKYLIMKQYRNSMLDQVYIYSPVIKVCRFTKGPTFFDSL